MHTARRAAYRCWMRRQIKNSKNVNISMQEVAGKKVVSFDEIPVRRVDSILATESQVKESQVK